MKSIITNCLIIFFLPVFSTIVFAQKKSVKRAMPKGEIIQIIDEAPSPPPPAAIDSRLKEFASEDGGFKIMLPGTPKKSVSTIDTAIGQITYNQYSAVGNAASYFVSYTDFPAPVTDPLELKIRYNSGRDNLIKSSPGSSLINEKDVYFGDHFGRELVIEKIDVTSTYRMFMVQQRLFQVVVFTPRLSKAPESIQDNYRKTIENFFNSFVITNVPPPLVQAQELPANFGLKIEGTNFNSEFFGFSIVLPQDWNKLNSDELEFLGKSGDALVAKKSQSVKDQFDLSAKNSRYLLTLTKLPVGAEENSTFKIIAERVSFAGFIPQKVLKLSTERLYVGQLGFQVTKPVESLRLGGIDFAHVGLINPINGTKAQLYLANRKDIALELMLIYVNDDDLATFKKMLQSIKLN